MNQYAGTGGFFWKSLRPICTRVRWVLVREGRTESISSSIRVAAALVLLLVDVIAVAGSVYKCKDPNGAVVYSQQPCGADAEEMHVDAGGGAPAMTVSYDKFNGVTKYESFKLEAKLDDRLHAQTIVQVGSGVFVAQILLTGGYTGGWKYLDCHDTRWLLDGRPVSVPEAKHLGKVPSTGRFVVEGISQDLPRSTFEEFAKARRIEAEVCRDQFELSPTEISGLHAIAERIAQQPSKPQE